MALNDHHRNKAEQEVVTSMRQAAPSCVFATAELLGNDLSSLPVRNIFILQRVSKTWKQMIAQSVGMQEQMFLRCSPKQPDVWEMLDEQLNRVPIMSTEDETDWEFVMKTRWFGKDMLLAPSHRKYVKLRRLVQAGNTIKGQDHLILPLTLNPVLRPSNSKHQRRSLVEKDERGVYSNFLYANMSTLDDCQRVTFGGTLGTLKRVAAIMEDVLQGLSKRGTDYAIITHGPLRDESSSCLTPYTDTIRCMELVTMAELPWEVKHADWEGLWVRKAIKVTLRFPDIDGVMPVVPTAVELDALVAC